MIITWLCSGLLSILSKFLTASFLTFPHINSSTTLTSRSIFVSDYDDSHSSPPLLHQDSYLATMSVQRECSGCTLTDTAALTPLGPLSEMFLIHSASPTTFLLIPPNRRPSKQTVGYESLHLLHKLSVGLNDSARAPHIGLRRSFTQLVG
jgi:hypothetical protein